MKRVLFDMKHESIGKVYPFSPPQARFRCRFLIVVFLIGGFVGRSVFLAHACLCVSISHRVAHRAAIVVFVGQQNRDGRPIVSELVNKYNVRCCLCLFLLRVDYGFVHPTNSYFLVSNYR